MKYKLINKKTQKEHICSKVVVKGFDYYLNNKISDISPNTLIYSNVTNAIVEFTDPRHFSIGTYFEVIATDNLNIDLPQVIDEIEKLAKVQVEKEGWGKYEGTSEQVGIKNSFIEGYNKSQETHSNTDNDMLSLIQSLKEYTYESHNILGYDEREPIEFLEIWEKQQTKTIYYE